MRRHQRTTTQREWIPQSQIFTPSLLFKIHHHPFLFWIVIACGILFFFAYLIYKRSSLQPEAGRRIYNHGVFYTKFLGKGESIYIKESYLKPFAERDTLHQPMEVTLLERISFSCLSRLRGINPDFSYVSMLEFDSMHVYVFLYHS